MLLLNFLKFMHHLKTKLFLHCKNDPLTCIFFFFFISNKISLKENNQLQRAKAQCAELNMKINKTKMHEKHNYQAKQVRN